jgi:hypothetical protein
MAQRQRELRGRPVIAEPLALNTTRKRLNFQPHTGMDKNISIQHIYKRLLHLGITRDQYDFSRTWLGNSQSYYSAIKCMGREPGSDTLMILALRLSALAQHLSTSTHFRTCRGIRATHGDVYSIASSVWAVLLKTSAPSSTCSSEKSI